VPVASAAGRSSHRPSLIGRYGHTFQDFFFSNLPHCVVGDKRQRAGISRMHTVIRRTRICCRYPIRPVDRLPPSRTSSTCVMTSRAIALCSTQERNTASYCAALRCRIILRCTPGKTIQSIKIEECKGPPCAKVLEWSKVSRMRSRRSANNSGASSNGVYLMTMT